MRKDSRSPSGGIFGNLICLWAYGLVSWRNLMVTKCISVGREWKQPVYFLFFLPSDVFTFANKYCIRHLNFMKAAFDGLAMYVYSLLSGLVCIGMFVLVVVHNSHMLPRGNSLCVGWWWRGQCAVEWQFAAQPCTCEWPLGCCSVLSVCGKWPRLCLPPLRRGLGPPLECGLNCWLTSPGWPEAVTACGSRAGPGVPSPAPLPAQLAHWK